MTINDILDKVWDDWPRDLLPVAYNDSRCILTNLDTEVEDYFSSTFGVVVAFKNHSNRLKLYAIFRYSLRTAWRTYFRAEEISPEMAAKYLPNISLETLQQLTSNDKGNFLGELQKEWGIWKYKEISGVFEKNKKIAIRKKRENRYMITNLLKVTGIELGTHLERRFGPSSTLQTCCTTTTLSDADYKKLEAAKVAILL